MYEKLEILECKKCANVVEVIKTGVGEIVCCNEPMKKMKENISQSSTPHYAFIETDKDNPLIKKISVKHKMDKEHYIYAIEIVSNKHCCLKRKHFEYTDIPELKIKCDCKDGFYVRVFCTTDGLWITK